MFAKIIGILLIGFGAGMLLSAVATVGNNWTIQKILFVSAIQTIIALIPLILGLKLYRK